MKYENTTLDIYSVFLISSFKINAQTEYGIKAGTNISKYTGDMLFNDVYNYRFGFYGGGFLNITINEKLKIQTELFFAQQGSNFVIKDIEIS